MDTNQKEDTARNSYRDPVWRTKKILTDGLCVLWMHKKQSYFSNLCKKIQKPNRLVTLRSLLYIQKQYINHELCRSQMLIIIIIYLNLLIIKYFSKYSPWQARPERSLSKDLNLWVLSAHLTFLPVPSDVRSYRQLPHLRLLLIKNKNNK